MRRHFNPRVFLIGLAVVVALGGCGYFLHVLQVRRNADIFLHQADKYKEEGNLAKEVESLHHYVTLRPDDTNAYCRFALAYASASDTNTRAREDALSKLADALRREPNRDDIRLVSLNLAMAIPRYTDARKQAQTLLAKKPKDPDLLEKLAICEDGLAVGAFAGEAEAAFKHYSEVIEIDPTRVQCYTRKAQLVRRLPSTFPGQNPDKIMEDLIEKNDKDYRAFLARANYLREIASSTRPEDATLDRFKLIAEASNDIAAAERLAPDNLIVLIAVVNDAHERGDVEKAQQALTKGMKLFPDEARFRFGLVQEHIRAGLTGEARKLLLELQDKLPKDATGQTLSAFTDLLIEVGETAEALKSIARLRQLKADPGVIDYLDAHVAASEKGTGFRDAITLLERARPRLAVMPDLARRAAMLMNFCLANQGNPEQQKTWLQDYIRNHPGDLEATYNLAQVEIALGNVNEGLALLSPPVLDRFPQGRLLAAHILIVRNVREPVDSRALGWAPVQNMLTPDNDAKLKQLRQTVDYHQIEIELFVARALTEMEGAQICAGHLQFDQACRKIAAGQALFRDADNVMAIAKAAAPREVRLRLTEAALVEIEDPMHYEEASRKALALIETAERELGDGAQKADLRLAKVSRQLGKATSKEAIERLRDAEKGTESWPKVERLRLLRGLVDHYARYSNTSDTIRRLLTEIKTKDPGGLQVRLQLFDLAISPQVDDFGAATRMREEIRAMEGDKSPVVLYADTLLLLSRYRNNQNPAILAKAQDTLLQVARMRPTWSRVPLMRAQFAELEGDKFTAGEQYRVAVMLGDHRFAVVRQAMELLLGQRRLAEAQQVAQAANTQGNGMGDRYMVQLVAVGKSDVENPLENAEEVVRADPTNAMNHLWIAQIAMANNNKERALKALREAVKLDPKAPETWTALLVFLAFDTPEHRTEAKSELENARKAVDSAKLPLVLGPTYEALGDLTLAEQQYKQGDPSADDLMNKQNLVSFYLRTGKTTEANGVLAQMIASPENNKRTRMEMIHWARRTMASQMALTGDYKLTTEARELLKKNQLTPESVDPEDERVYALINAVRPGERKKAIERMEKARHDRNLNLMEILFLVHLHEADLNDSKAKTILSELAEKEEKENPVVLTYFIRFLLRTHKLDVQPYLIRQRDELALANEYVAVLKRKQPDNPTTVELEARVLAEKETAADVAKAVELLKSGTEKQFQLTKDPRAFLTAASVMEDVEEKDKPAKDRKKPETEKLMRRFVAEATANPAEFKKLDQVLDPQLLLAFYLGRHQRMAEAIDILEKEAKDPSAERAAAIASTGVSIVRANDPEKVQSPRVLALINGYLEKNRSAGLLLSLADLRDAMGEYDEAIRAYGEVIGKDATNVTAMNNRACLLAIRQGNNNDALKLINEAIQRWGPQATLLDTRGMIYLKVGNNVDAIKDFTAAITQDPNYGRYFHLALAQKDKQDQVIANMKQARRFGYQRYSVHPLEEPVREELERSVQ